MKPYSASKLGTYDDCHKKYYWKYVKKVDVPFIPKKYFEKGSYIHHILENFPTVPEKEFKFRLSNKNDINEYHDIIQKAIRNNDIKRLLTKSKGIRELSFKISKDFKIQNKKDKDTLFIGQIDWIGTDEGFNGKINLTIIDWKTGKFYPNKSPLQLKLYALVGLLKYPENVQDILGIYYYIESHNTTIKSFRISDLESLKEYFLKKINKIETDTQYRKNITNLCDYCDFYNICDPHNGE